MPWYIWVPFLTILVVVVGFFLWPSGKNRIDFVLVCDGGIKKKVCFLCLPNEMTDTEIHLLLSDLGLTAATPEILDQVFREHPNFCPRGRTVLLSEDDTDGAVWVGVAFESKTQEIKINKFPRGFPKIHPKGDCVIAMS